MNTIELEVTQYTNDEGQLVYEGYYLKGHLHNPHGPAVRRWNHEGQLVYEAYWLNNRLHNPRGPAARRWNDEGRLVFEAYCLKGRELTKDNFLLQLNSCSGKIVTIDGKQYKLQEV